jgi:lipopolysaccharide export system protein LptC
VELGKARKGLKAGGMAYAATPEYGGGRPQRASNILPRDSRREAEFKRARGHSRTVFMLKGLLPLTAAAILSLYILPSFLKVSVDKGRGEATATGISIEAGTFVIENPHVSGATERGEPYDITAKQAKQAASSPEVMHLLTVRGKMTSADGRVSTLTAPDATNNSKTEEIVFDNGVDVSREGGMSASFEKATAYMKQQYMVSKTPVTVRLQESTIHAQNMTLYWNESRAVFEGGVRTHIVRVPDQTPAEKPASGTDTQIVDVTLGASGDSNDTR